MAEERIHHCYKCGKILESKQNYCPDCKIIADKEANRRRSATYREKHRKEVNDAQKKWCEEHPEQRRLISRNYFHRHPVEHKQRLKDWRKKNPEKVKLQNQRAKKNQKRKLLKRLYSQGIRRTIRYKLTCPKCTYVWKSHAKRPQCVCGYSFPRNYFQTELFKSKKKDIIIDFSVCKTCGREIPYQGRGSPREHCDSCLPQIMALKSYFAREKYDKEHPEKWRKWFQNNEEIVVAMTCKVCGNLVLYKGKGRLPHKCGLCKCIERSRPKPLWNPKDIVRFIEVEKHRLGLDKNKKWGPKEIRNFYIFWDKQYTYDPEYLAVTEEE